MGGGSAKPGRRRAAGPALRYEHRRDGRSSVRPPGSRRGGVVSGCLLVVGSVAAFLALIGPLVAIDMRWGHRAWGDVAPAWPGGVYAFGATLGALLPLTAAALVAPLTRMKWRRSRLRSLARVLAALPGLAAGWLVLGVIGASWRPRERRDWDGACYREGGACWVHERFPYLGAVGLAATVAVSAVLIALLVRHVMRKEREKSVPPGAGPAT
ncbi:hypothetical protein ACIQFU_03305 [Streptomyces sp. NPDC093065]|uniref:hypothetical protein n=1 Tax=Streptomyces sp. NPDC093065 TaxID=3366021 RepID=UPI0038248458